MISLIDLFVSIFLPNRCLSCADIILSSKLLCAKCNGNMRFIQQGNSCVRCGNPYSQNVEFQRTCAACIGTSSMIMRSSFIYNDAAKQIISKFKFCGNAQMAKRLSTFIVQASSDIINGVDIIVPTPVHLLTLMNRHYNQSTLLATYLAKHYDVLLDCNLVIKSKRTTPQRLLRRSARASNLRGSFQVCGDVENQVVLLVDDVITTGTTMRELRKVLLKARAKEVRAVSLARTLLLS